MNPLLVSYNKMFNSIEGIENIANLRIKFDCDFIQKNINPSILKKLHVKRFINMEIHTGIA